MNEEENNKKTNEEFDNQNINTEEGPTIHF